MNSFTVFTFFFALLVAVFAWEHEEHHHPRPYKFAYGVSDHHTGDHHQQHEVSDGHVVRGSYSLKEADGTIRIVDYVAGPHTGFNAVVRRIGHAHHPQHYGHHEHGGIEEQGGFEQEGIGGGYGQAESYIGSTHWGYNY